MNSLPIIALTAASFLFFACEGYSQEAAKGQAGTVSISAQEAGIPPHARTISVAPPSSHEPVVTDAPYSAEIVNEHVQTLADGTHITQKAQSTKVYRDSAGRTRRETSPGGAQVAEIHDPVSGFRYLLDVQNHVAHRFAPPAERSDGVARYTDTIRADSSAANSAPARSITTAQALPERPQSSTESLGLTNHRRS